MNKIPLIHVAELDKVRSELRKNIKTRGDNGEIDTMEVALFLDGATRVAECYCFVARFVFESYIQQRIIALRMLSKSLTAAEVADQFNKVVTARHGIASKRVLAINNDRASVNLASFNILSPFFRRAINVGCFNHTLANAGDQIP